MVDDQIQNKVIHFVRNGGNDSKNFRDAIHEASHAVELNIPYGDWDREVIHDYILRLEKPDRVRTELLARAVEWSACERFGIEYDIDHWALIAFMEAFKSDVRMPESIVESIESFRGEESELILDRILTMSMGQ